MLLESERLSATGAPGQQFGVLILGVLLKLGQVGECLVAVRAAPGTIGGAGASTDSQIAMLLRRSMFHNLILACERHLTYQAPVQRLAVRNARALEQVMREGRL